MGLLIDLNDLISSKLGLEIVYKTTTVQSGLPGLTSGQYDMMSVGLVASEERKKSSARVRSARSTTSRRASQHGLTTRP